MKSTILSFFLVSMIVATAVGQDLNRLQSRAEKLLTLKSGLKIDKAQAVQYLESKSRQEFLESNPFPMSDAQVTGIEFTSDPKSVYVIFKAKVFLPEIGWVPRTGREPWLWENKNWFLRLEDLGNPFAASNHGEAVPAKT